MELIVLRASASDKEFREKIENKTLGALIEFYKICAIKAEDGNLLTLLKQYNRIRNYLIHRIIKDSNFINAISHARKANEIGLRAIKILISHINTKNVSNVILKELQKQ